MSMRSPVLTPERCEIECLHPEHVGPLLGAVIGPTDALDLAELLAIFADPTRLRIVHALGLADELCVCDLAWLVGSSQSAVSHQLRVLRDRGVVAREKRGRIVYYRIADARLRGVLLDAIQRLVTDRAPLLGKAG